jgi:membrane associated rhomboid family serine protease
MAICIALFITLELVPEKLHHYFVSLYGMVPARYTNPSWAIAMGYPQDYFLSFVTNLFLHGGWWHLIINMWFLWIFADNVEGRMGHGRFIVFYLLCGVAATAIQWAYTPQLVFPVIGASGAIAGVLGAYFFLYPYAKIVLWVPLFLLPIFIEIPAIAFIGVWVIWQMQKATTALMFNGGASNIALWAHLGGFVVGMLIFRFFLRKEYPE